MFNVQSSKFKVQGSRFKVQGSKFKVQGSSHKVIVTQLITFFLKPLIIMASVKRFEDLDVWKISRQFNVQLFDLINKNQNWKMDFKLREQINGAAGSIMDNIAEGFERGGNKELINFLRYSKGSAGETRSQLYRALDRNYLTADEFDELIKLIVIISGKIQNMITYLKSSDKTGINYMK